jgi:ABC-2 type transport system ATP-binding protein
MPANGTLVRTRDPRLHQALQHRGVAAQAAPDGALRVDADPATVGEIALAARVPLTELRASESAGLEEMFLRLTTNTDRDRRPDRTVA